MTTNSANNQTPPNHLNADQQQTTKPVPETDTLDGIPSVNSQAQDTQSKKKLKTLAVLLATVLIAIAGIVMATSRYSENKAQHKAAEAQKLADEQKKLADGTAIDIAADQQKIQDNKLYALPSPSVLTDGESNLNTESPAPQAQAVASPPIAPVYTPPDPIANSHYAAAAHSNYTPPAPVPVYTPDLAPQVTTPTVVDLIPNAATSPPQNNHFGGEVLVDVYNKKDTQPADQAQAASAKTAKQVTRRQGLNTLLLRGTSIPCVLKTKIDSTYQGFTVCQVSKDIYSANGAVLLIERGSSVFGEQNTELKQGQARVAVLWHSIETPTGVMITIDSPAAGALGEMGIDADVDTHFAKRFGNAILLSIIQDAGAAAATHLEKSRPESSTTITNTSKPSQNMAEEALKNSINIAPIATVNQGALINILVVRDVDFSSVYQLKQQ